MYLLPRYDGLLFLATFLSSRADSSLNYLLPLTGIIFEELHAQMKEEVYQRPENEIKHEWIVLGIG